MKADGAPRYTVVEHEAGLILAGGRHADEGQTYWRIAQYLMPNHSLAPGGAAGQTNSWPDLGSDRRHQLLGLHL